jgi:hippurate hydrolase
LAVDLLTAKTREWPRAYVAAARKEGKEVPFYVHQPNYMVDLDAIPFGTKVAAMIALDVLGK